VRIEGEIGREVHLLDMSADGDEIAMEGLSDAQLLFGHAEPLGEPVVAQGPFVMNTREEIIQAYRDYQAGKFGSAVSIR
jgi:quercetin 2,3-dioxygenase